MNQNQTKNVPFRSFTDANANTIHVQLKAKSFFGARHGLSTLQQLIWFDDEDNLLRVMSAAHVIDEPKFKWIIFQWYHTADWILGNYVTHFLFDPIKLVQKTGTFFFLIQIANMHGSWTCKSRKFLAATQTRPIQCDNHRVRVFHDSPNYTYIVRSGLHD